MRWARTHPTLAALTPMKYLGKTNETLRVINLEQIGMIIGVLGAWNTYYNTSVSDRWITEHEPRIHANLDIEPREFLRLPYRRCTECYPSSKKHHAGFGRFPERLPRVQRWRLIMMSDDGEAVQNPWLWKREDPIVSDSVSTNPGQSPSSSNDFPLEPRLVERVFVCLWFLGRD